MKKNNTNNTQARFGAPKLGSLILRSSMLALAIGAFVPSAQALVIRHDTETKAYENYGKWARFTASCTIVRANNQNHGISGSTAIDRSWSVGARHTLRHVETWMANGDGGAVIRGSKWNAYNGGGRVRWIREITHYDDDFTRFSSTIDIALAENWSENSAFKIALLGPAWDEVGRIGSGASAANNRSDGNGNSRKGENESTSDSSTPREVRWAGRNTIDRKYGNSFNGSPSNSLLGTDLDHPTNASFSSAGGTSANTLEFGTAGGDSGSPLYYDKNGTIGYIGGVLSGGIGNGYGSQTVYVRIRPYRNWILDTMN